MLLKKKFAFSLVELLISLIVISCITAAFTPIITKKFSSGVFGGGGTGDLTTDCADKFGDYCTLCTSGGCIDCGISCPQGQYKDTKSCTCKDCKETYGEDCEKCTEKKCLTCAEGKFPSGNTCTNCDAKYPNCATCDETICKTCQTDYKLVDGECVPDCTKLFTSNCTACTIDSCSACIDGYELINGQCVDNCKQKFGEGCISCSTNTCNKCDTGYKLKNGKCELDCGSKFGSKCTTCTIDKCTACSDGYEPTNASGNPACTFTCSGKYFMKIGSLCITRRNMGDGGPLYIYPSGVKFCSTNYPCDYDWYETCWRGQTAGSDYCDSGGIGGYSGCSRTVCPHGAAETMCKEFNYAGKKWRLPTRAEMKTWGSNQNNLENNGLQFCDFFSPFPSTTLPRCNGTSNNVASFAPGSIWAGDVDYFVYVFTYYNYSCSSGGSWIEYQEDYDNTNRSTRCVTEF